MLNCYEGAYAALVRDVLDNGAERRTRNAVTKSVFGRTLRFEADSNEFPLLHGRRMYPRGVLGELAALLRGPKTLGDFKAQGCNYWDQWADADGSIRVDYGNAWLDFNGVDQLAALVAGLRANPYGRRHIVTGWRPDRLAGLSLPCCHLLYQWYVRDVADANGSRRKLDMVWYQRSVDTMVGLPSDVVLAYTWNTLVANEVGMQPGEVVMMLGDTHVYEQHYAAATEYLGRVDRLAADDRDHTAFHAPCVATMRDFVPAMMRVTDYTPEPKIELELLT